MKETLIDKWVINTIVILLVLMFCAIVMTALILTTNQVVYHYDNPSSFASEFVGILNSIFLIGLGVFFSSILVYSLVL